MGRRRILKGEEGEGGGGRARNERESRLITHFLSQFFPSFALWAFFLFSTAG